MLRISVFLVVISVVSCQIDGEFWWLKHDVTKLQDVTAPPPMFDDVNELDTDETAKVVFRDSEGKEGKSLMIDDDKLSLIHFRDKTELSKPFEFNKLNENNKVWERPLKQIDVKNNITSQNTEDEFRFVFPSDDNFIWSDNDTMKNKRPLTTENTIESSNKVSFTTKTQPQNVIVSDDKNHLLPESICTFIKKSECIRSEGTLYEPWISPKINIPDTQIVCCILPITTTSMAKIIFPDRYWSFKRHKRSNGDGENPALKQRNVLMSRKYTLENLQARTTPTTRKRVSHKVTNSDEYSTDPYWNIKNPNIRNPNIPIYQDPDLESDYGSQSYGDDYTVELPKPGLVGLYSDNNKQTQTTWTANKNKGFYYDTSYSDEDEGFEPSFGYGAIDPRRDHRVTTVPSRPSRPKPSKLTSRLPDHNLQNPTITFHSNPDFQLLQGFKLLNLVRNKNRFVRKTSESKNECADNGLKQENPQKLNHYASNYEDGLFESNLKQKLFNECGRTQTNHGDCENGLQSGVVESGSHPWIALVVLTKSEHSMLCYATIIHSRVAVTIADCVTGQSPGTVSIIAGVRNLEDLHQSQRRMATITLDSDYTPGKVEYNLALLHWLRPLLFDARVQPACLGNPHTEDQHCIFVGWGGYDQEMQSELRWQRASILSAQDCSKRLSKLEVSDALCATVQSRGTVTGVGGPLLCNNKDRWSAVGIAAWRNDVIILLPLREWVTTTMKSLRIQ